MQSDNCVVLSIDFSRKYRINGINYLINSLRVTVSANQIKPAVIELYKM